MGKAILQKNMNLTEGKVLSGILRFSLPVFAGSLFNMAYNLADIRIVGSYLGNDALAAVGSVSTFTEMVLLFIVGMANGCAVQTAQTYGMGKMDRLRKTFALSLLCGAGSALILSLLTLLGLRPILGMLRVMDIHMGMSTTYVRVLFTGLLFASFYNTLAASLRAIGDAFTPLLFLIFSACLNVGLDILFVGTLSLGVGGAAGATVISQLVSAVLCLLYTLKRYDFLRFRKEDFRPDKGELKRMLPGGISMGLMNSIVSIGTVSLQTAINSLGTNVIVAHTATRKLTSLFMLPHCALGATMTAFAGQNYGAGRTDRIRRGLFITLGICYAWSVAVAVMAYTICGGFIRLITDTQIAEVIDTACSYQRVHTLFYVVCTSISVLRNTLQGMGEHRIPIVSSMLELLCKVVFAFGLTPLYGYTAIIWSEPVAWVIMVIPLVIMMVHYLHRPITADVT